MSSATTNKKRILAQALCDAIDWRESLAHANGSDTPQANKCLDLVKKYREALAETGFSKPDPFASAKAISLEELRRSSRG